MIPALEIKKKLYDYASSRTRESWIVTLIKRLIEKDGKLCQSDIEKVTEMLYDENLEPEMLTAPAATSDPQLEIKKLTHICGVNALMPYQTINFCEEGITFIYGLNGSGKSSYYKSLQCLAGKSTKLTPNIYATGTPLTTQKLEITYSTGGADVTSVWDSGSSGAIEAMKDVAFFDSSYATHMIESVKASEIVLRPYDFPLIESLERAFDELIRIVIENTELSTQIDNHRKALSPLSYFKEYISSLKPLFEFELRELNIQHIVKVDVTSNSEGLPCLSLRMTSGNYVKEIMSEGELKGVSLALFLAQIQMLSPNVPVIFDDPVNSFDSYIMQRFIKRISGISNQVIIFSHNIMLLEMCKSGSSFKQVDTTAIKAKRTSATSHKRNVFIYTIETLNLGQVGCVYPDKKGFDAQVFLEKAHSQLNDLTSDIDNIIGNLRKAIEHLIDEKIFMSYTPPRFRLPNSHLRWADFSMICTQGDVTIKELRKAYEELSNGGSHVGFGSIAAPMSRADCLRIYNFLMSL